MTTQLCGSRTHKCKRCSQYKERTPIGVVQQAVGLFFRLIHAIVRAHGMDHPLARQVTSNRRLGITSGAANVLCKVDVGAGEAPCAKISAVQCAHDETGARDGC